MKSFAELLGRFFRSDCEVKPLSTEEALRMRLAEAELMIKAMADNHLRLCKRVRDLEERTYVPRHDFGPIVGTRN